MEDLFPTKEGYIPPTNETSSPAPILTPDNINVQQSNLYQYPHKGIFQPDTNTLICKTHCCCKYIGLFIILFGAFFGIIFPTIGIATNMIAFIITGSSIFLVTIIEGIILFCTITTEVKFIFSNPMVEITISAMCSKKQK